MTNQEIFDKVATHLFTQGEQAGVWLKGDEDDESSFKCRYRGAEGKMCAVGCLIPDDLYDEMMENSWVGAILNEFPQLDFLASHRSILAALQNVHDASSESLRDPWQSTEEMRTQLARIALAYELDPAILDTLSFQDR